MELFETASSASFKISPCISWSDFQCRSSLESTLLANLSTNSTLLLEAGVHTISQSVTLVNLNSLSLEGSTNSTEVIVHCFGLSFIVENFSHLLIRNIQVSNCSLELTNVSALAMQNLLVTGSSTLFFSKCNRMRIVQTKFYNVTHQGTTLHFTDCQHAKIILCQFVENTISGDLIVHDRSTSNFICCLFKGNKWSEQGHCLIRMHYGSEMRVSNSSFLNNNVTNGFIITSLGFTDRLAIYSSRFHNNFLDKYGNVIWYGSDNDLVIIATDISRNVGGFLFLRTRYSSVYLFCTTIQGNSWNGLYPIEQFKLGNDSFCQHYKAGDKALCNETAICEGK